MTDPLDTYAVIWHRDACGAVESVQLWAGTPDTGTLLLDTAANETDAGEALAHMLRIASGYYKHDPRDTDALPPDHAVIAAYWDHLA